MKFEKIVLLIAIFLSGGIALDAECSSELPATVKAFVAKEAQQGWRIVSLEDLPQDDNELWRREHAGQCPGVTQGRFTNGYSISYAVALLKATPNGRYLEKLIVLIPTRDQLSPTVLVRPTSVVSPFVVWKLPPGKYSGIDGRPAVSIATDSFVYEKMEAIATQYFYIGGKFRSLRTAD